MNKDKLIEAYTKGIESEKGFTIINNYFKWGKESSLVYVKSKISLFYLKYFFKEIGCETVYSLLEDQCDLHKMEGVFKFKTSLLYWFHDHQNELKDLDIWKKKK